MGILRVGHVKLRVMDVEAAVRHYEDILGMATTYRDSEGSAYLKCWDEWDRYSVILSRADRPGLDHVAFKVTNEDNLEQLAARVRAYGIPVDSLPAGSLPLSGRSIRFALPSGHDVRLYATKELVGTQVGDRNPDPWPDGLKGAGVHWLDHLALVCEFKPETGINKVAENTAFFQDVLDFKLTECGMAGLGGKEMVAAFLARTSTPHDIAFVAGPSMGLHHVAFFLDDWNAVLRAADVVAKVRKDPSLTPNRHGMTRGATFYAFDPSGNRNETFAGLGYLAQPDRPLVTWTEDQLDRGLFFLGGENRSFLERYT